MLYAPVTGTRAGQTLSTDSWKHLKRWARKRSFLSLVSQLLLATSFSLGILLTSTPGSMVAATSADVVFVEPLHSPGTMHDWDYISAIVGVKSQTNQNGQRSADWRDLEMAWMDHLEYLQVEHAEELRLSKFTSTII